MIVGDDEHRLPRAGRLTGVELLDGGGGGDAVLGDVEVELASRPRVDDEALVVGVGLEGHAVDEVEVHDLLGVLADVVLDDATRLLDGLGQLAFLREVGLARGVES